MGSLPERRDLCPVCSVPSTKFCAGCKKVHYCGVEHQKKDRKRHRKDCFPAVLSWDQVQGRYFAATKDIRKGELIFQEKALVVGPNGAEKYFHPICLGCYRVVRSQYVCSRCKWPLCSQNCEQLPAHRDAECPIFASRHILPSVFSKPYEYDFIKFLRSLLLREEDGEKWVQLQKLASHPEARGECEASVLATIASFEFLTETCGLKEYDYDTINHIVGVWGVNSFGANAPSGPHPTGRLASFLFPKTSLCSHSCVANTRGILLEAEEELPSGMIDDGRGKDKKSPAKIPRPKRPVFSMELLASQDIPEGSPILITYAEVGEGTWERQKILRENYYFRCECPRCEDPTEFGSFFSAHKCPHCPQGYLLPRDPLQPESDWACTAHPETCPLKGYYPDLAITVGGLKKELNAVGMDDTEGEIRKLEEILRENSGVRLHGNHWLLVEVEFRLIQRLISFMPQAKAGAIPGVIRKCIQHATHCLQVANIVRPGWNPYRGKILYCLCQAQLQEVIRSSTSTSTPDLFDRRTNLTKLLAGMEESRQILSKEPPGSDERTIGDSLQEDLAQIQRIISLLDSQIKHGRGEGAAGGRKNGVKRK